MSLLLRGEGKDGRGGQTNRLLPNMKRRVQAAGMPRFNPCNVNNGNRNLSTGGLLGDDQIMLQRKIVSPIPTQQQVVDHQHRQQSTHRMEQKQCVISMEEVMNDLRLLEEQQREAQRKVAIMKLSKQQKEEQLQKVEQNLASLQYTNAQQREQLERCRQLMSVQTRELGAVKLRSSKSTSDLKRFDDKLRSGLQVMHELSRQHRVIETKMVQLENCSCILERQKAEAEKNLQASKASLHALQHKENLLIKTIQSSKNDARALTDEINKVRSCSNELEEDLRIATQMETRTKVNLETKAAEIESEEKRHGQVIEEKQGLLQGWLVRRDELQANIIKKKELLEEKHKLILLLQEQSETVQNELWSFTSEEGLCNLDTHKMQLQLEKEKRCVSEEIHRQVCLKLTIESMQNEVWDTEEKATENNQIAESRKKEIDVRLCVEKERSINYDSVCVEVEKERNDVKKLHAIVSEITEEFQSAQEHTLSELTCLRDNLNALKEQTGIMTNILETESARSDEAKEKYNMTIDDIAVTNQQIKESIRDTNNRLLVAQDSVLHIIKNHDDCEQVLLQLDEGHNILLRQTIDESSRLVEKYPILGALNYSFDFGNEEDDQTETALAGLLAECKERLNCARNEWQRRYNMAQMKHLEAIRKKEEEERCYREREEKRRQDEEEERQLRENEEKRRQKQEEERQHRENEEKRRQNEEEERQHREKEEKRKKNEEEERQHREKEETRRQDEEEERHHREREENHRQDEKEERHYRVREENRRQNEEKQSRYREKRRQNEKEQRRYRKSEEKRRRDKEEQSRYRENEGRSRRDKEEQARSELVHKHYKEKKKDEEKGKQIYQDDKEKKNTRVKPQDEHVIFQKESLQKEEPFQRLQGKDQENFSAMMVTKELVEAQTEWEIEGTAIPKEQVRSRALKQITDCTTKVAPPITDGAKLPSSSRKRQIVFRDSEKAPEAENPKKRRKEKGPTPAPLNDKKHASSPAAQLGLQKKLGRSKSYSESLPKELKQKAETIGKDKSIKVDAHSKSNLFQSQCLPRSKYELSNHRAINSDGPERSNDISLMKRTHRLEGNVKANMETNKYLKTNNSNTKEDSTSDVAPLVQAALTAASQETVRVSQTSTHLRSRHKRTSQLSQKPKKHNDVFGSNDVSFLHAQSPIISKTQSNAKPVSKAILPLRCSGNQRTSHSNSVSLASSSQMSSELPNQCKSISNVRVRRKKNSHKGASQSSLDEDFGFL